MKKSILAFLISSVTYFSAVAQGPVSFGIKGGLNIADFSDGDFRTRTSFHLGGLAHIHLSRYFAIQPEAVYSEQGARLVTGVNTTAYKFNYINLPVLLQFMAGNGFRVETGPQLGFLTSAKAEAGNVTVDIKDSYNKTDFAWAIGAGYLSPLRIGVDVRYNLGITEIRDGGANNRNNVFQLGAFYQFR